MRKIDKRAARGVVPSTKKGRGSLTKSNSPVDNLTEDNQNVKKQYSVSEHTVKKRDVARQLQAIIDRGGDPAELQRYVNSLQGDTSTRGRSANVDNLIFMTTWTVIRGYEQNGKVMEVENLLEHARAEIQKLGSDSEHYKSLRGFYTTINSYLELCSNPELSFTQFTEMQNQYEKEARDYISDLGFSFGE